MGATGRYNGAMRRLLPLLAAAWLLVAVAPAVRADNPADPTGQAGAGSATAGLDLRSEPLLPYVVGLLVAGVVLAVVGVVVMQTGRRRPKPAAGPGPARALWTCPACGAGNAPGRTVCYACHTPVSTDDPAPGPDDPVPPRT